ncbi:MAG: ATP-dependent helicase, partial [Defluviitaleaceae bacterium]|nr:ATP-dependent helicase [Defluviitaleaceae bacterium]
MKKSSIDFLNSSQQKAVIHKNGPMIVIAGPGSGKTTVIVHRVKYLVENGIKPSEILVVTYSKAAAINMGLRYKKLGEEPVTFSTFHSLFFKILRTHTNISLDNMVTEENRKDLIKEKLKELGSEYDEDLLNDIFLQFSLIKNDQLDIESYKSFGIESRDFRILYNHYENHKKEENKIDFDDMLTKTYELLQNEKILNKWKNKFKYIMIDEFQDISRIQYNIVRLLSTENIYIVGDDDQSIYHFRGSRPEFILNFNKDYENAKQIILDVNYRSTNQIINLSNRIIKFNTIRYDKTIKGTNKEGKSPVLIKAKTVNDEANHIASKIRAELENNKDLNLSEICIIYRTNIQARAFAESFAVHNIPYQIKDDMPTMYQHFVSKDILSYMAYALNNYDNEALSRVVNKPMRYINKAVISSFEKDENPLIKSLQVTKLLKEHQQDRITELAFHLDRLKKLSPTKAIDYIRNKIGYDNYIKNYTAYMRVKT